jgi:tetratricopeptide (TPR) repeat protein
MDLEQWRHHVRARFFQFAKQPERALEEYRAALEINPRLAKAWANIAYIHAKQGRFREAERNFLEALRIAPRDAEMLFNLGYVRNELKQHAGAIEAFSETVKLKPGLDMAWYGMGLAYAALGEHKAAVNAFEQAARLQPMAAPIWYQLGMACHHALDTERVRAVIHHLNRFDPRTARRLITDTGTTDLAYLVKDLVV